MGIIAFLILGLLAGAIAKRLLPGSDPGGFIVTMLIGVAGALRRRVPRERAVRCAPAGRLLRRLDVADGDHRLDHPARGLARAERGSSPPPARLAPPARLDRCGRSGRVSGASGAPGAGRRAGAGGTPPSPAARARRRPRAGSPSAGRPGTPRAPWGGRTRHDRPRACCRDRGRRSGSRRSAGASCRARCRRGRSPPAGRRRGRSHPTSGSSFTVKSAPATSRR